MPGMDRNYITLKQQFLQVHEKGGPGYMTEKMVSLPERLIKCAWYDQLLDKKLMKTLDGRRVRVYSQGDWNLGAGPDFKSALVQFDNDDPVRGDVEIHVRSGDWKRHGHHKNSEYNGVALHVCMWNDTGEESIELAGGTAAPELQLSSCLLHDIPTLNAIIDMENYPFNSESRIGQCSIEAASNPERTKQLIEMAARERFFIKSLRYKRELGSKKFRDVLYAGILEGLGYRRNKAPFRRLAEAVPLRLARRAAAAAPPLERTVALQSLYFGASGLFSDIEIDMWDEETREYCEALAAHWENYEDAVDRSDRLRKKDWTLRGVRPANFPVRRVAGLAQMMAAGEDSDIVGSTMAFAEKIRSSPDVKSMKQALDGLYDTLVQEGDGYWASHMTPAGKTLEIVPSLIGKSLAQTLILNIILPLLLARAQQDNDTRLQDRLAIMFSVFPRLGANQITRLMNYRLWGNTKGNVKLTPGEAGQQGLIQVFFDFCDENIRDCSHCAFPKMLRGEK